MKRKTLIRRIWNRIAAVLARLLPGCQSIRPILHRLRGMKIGANVFIGDDVYLENEYPECIEIGDNVEIALRSIVLAHSRGKGKVIIGKDAHIGPNCIVLASGGKTIRIGEGSVIGSGLIVSKNIPDNMFVPSVTSNPIARVTEPYHGSSLEDFVRGLRPIHGKRKSQKNSKTTAETEETP